MKRGLGVDPVRMLVIGSVALAAATIALAACSKKITTNDPKLTVPEGVFSAEAQLIVWRDAVNPIVAYQDQAPLGPTQNLCTGVITPDPADPDSGTLTVDVSGRPIQRYTPGTLVGVILDGTPSNDFQILRKESNGGYLRHQDFLAPRTLQWLQSEWEMYRFSDPAPSGYQPPTYTGRGLVGGVVQRTSPLTNEAHQTSGSIDNIQYLGVSTPCDSLFKIKWSPVAEAVRYWIHVYQFRQAPAEEQVLSGGPSPIYDGAERDILVAVAPPGVTEFRVNDNTTVRVLFRRGTLFGQSYLVRVSAVDAAGNLIGQTQGDLEKVENLRPYLGAHAEGKYGLFRLGAGKVTPSHSSENCSCQRD
jgi:hypothetical protein